MANSITFHSRDALSRHEKEPQAVSDYYQVDISGLSIEQGNRILLDHSGAGLFGTMRENSPSGQALIAALIPYCTGDIGQRSPFSRNRNRSE